MWYCNDEREGITRRDMVCYLHDVTQPHRIHTLLLIRIPSHVAQQQHCSQPVIYRNLQIYIEELSPVGCVKNKNNTYVPESESIPECVIAE